jgi:hypothetical protein
MKWSLLILTALPFTQGCWMMSKPAAIERVRLFITSRGMDPNDGVTIEMIHDVERDLPSGIAWIINKVGGAENIMDRCDLNKDRVIHFDEVLAGEQCMSACWKQTAIRTWLN